MKNVIFATAVCFAIGASQGFSDEGANASKNIAAELKNSTEFKALDADRQKLAEAFLQYYQKNLNEPSKFYDPIKFSILGANEAAAVLAKQNQEAREANAKTKESLTRLLEELDQHGIRPDAETSGDMQKLNHWLHKLWYNPKETSGLPDTLKKKLTGPTIRGWTYLSEVTVEEFLGSKSHGHGHFSSKPDLSRFLLRSNVLAGAYDKQKAYDYAYNEQKGTEENYRKFYAKRFSELVEESGNKVGSQSLINIRSQISHEWSQNQSK